MRAASTLCVILAGVAFSEAAFTIGLHEVRAKTSGHKPDGEQGESSSFYTVKIKMGTKSSQVFDVRLDTYSNMLVLPSNIDGDTSSKRLDGTYQPIADGATKIGCHSMQCLPVASSQVSASAAPSICQKKVPGHGWACPNATDVSAGATTMSGATCKQSSALQSNPTVCADHLQPPCKDVLDASLYNYSCSTDMGIFGASFKGKKLSSMCPVTCGSCPAEAVRYCADNVNWVDGNNQRCADYANPVMGLDCFASEAYIACPKSCGACGDCCTGSDGCFFYEFYRSGGHVEGTKYQDQMALENVQDSNCPGCQPVSLVNKAATVGAIQNTSQYWDPNVEIDGVWGLGNTESCNPACSNNSMLGLSTLDGTGVGSQIAFCLADQNSISSMDLGGLVPAHQNGDMQTIPLENSNFYMTEPPIQVTIEHGESGGTQTLPSGLTRNSLIVDITSPWILFPINTFEAFKTALIAASPTLPVDVDATSAPQGTTPTNNIFTSSCADIGNNNGYLTALPTLNFYFTNVTGKTSVMSFGPKEYLVALQFNVKNASNASQTVVATRLCSAVKDVQTDDFVIGQMALRSKYIVITRKDGQDTLGFAPKGDCSKNVFIDKSDPSSDPSKCSDAMKEWQCSDGTCIPESSRGDCVFDCLDGSDENKTCVRDERCKTAPVKQVSTGQGVAPTVMADGQTRFGQPQWRLDEGDGHNGGEIKVSAASFPSGDKLGILYCKDGFRPRNGKSVVTCNSNKEAKGFKNTNGWETLFESDPNNPGAGPCEAIPKSNTSCKEVTGAGGITCGQLLIATGKCATGLNCEQSACDWATSAYSLSCECNCKKTDVCGNIQTQINAACGASTQDASVFQCPTVTGPTCKACNSTQWGDSTGACFASDTGSLTSCKACSPCAHECTIALIDQAAAISTCNTDLGPFWSKYTSSLMQVCGGVLPSGHRRHLSDLMAEMIALK